jgi:hypothetical protein
MANQFPGDFSLKEVNLYPHFGNKVDIKGIVGEITLYESVLSASLQCTILVQDIGQNLINTLPLMGEERVEIIILSNNIWYTLNYYIYKIDARVMNEKNQSYVMSCISVEGLRNENFKICERVDGKKSEDLVKEILKQSNFTSKKILPPDETVYPFNMYIPNWRPFDAIIWLARRSVPIYKQNSIGFLFYETFDGFKYKSIDVLFDQPLYPNQNIKYQYFQGNQSTGAGSQSEKYRVMNYASPKAFDLYDDLRRGAFAHECIYLDVNRRSYKVFRSNADEFWSNSSHLEKMKPYKTTTNQRDEIGLLKRGSRFIYRPSTISTWGQWDENQSTKDSDNVDEVNKNYEKALYRYYFLEYNHMEIAVPGDLQNRCGNVIYLSIPSPKKNTDGSVKEDERVSGRYLVNSIKHTILNRSELRTTITLTRDSFGGSPVPDQKETTGGQIMLEGKN